MKTISLFLASLFFFFSLFVSPVFAKGQENHILPQDQIINNDYFAAGDSVTILGTINGDAYVAGGNITFDGTVNGDIIAAGGTINIRGTAQNVRVAGGTIIINGTIAKNLTVFGGDVTLGENATLLGSIVAGGGSITLLSPVGRGATIGGGQVNINDIINGNVYAGVGQLTLQPQAKINGNLTYVSDEQVQLLQGSTISGQLTHTLPPKQQPDQEQNKQAILGLGAVALTFKLINMLSILIIGLILIALAPNFVKRVADGITTKPWQSLGFGIVTLFLAPIIFIILLITIVGIPLAFISLILYFVVLYIAKLFVIYLLGTKIGNSINSRMHSMLFLLIGLIVYEIVTLIPFIGWLVDFVALAFGLGSLLMQKKQLYTTLRREKII